MWEITKEWEVRWNEWKTGSFKTLKTEVMENTAFHLFRRLNKLSKELKVSGVVVCEREAQTKRGATGKHNHCFQARGKASLGNPFPNKDLENCPYLRRDASYL